MTADELNQKYTEAGWLIAKRSASAAGKALLFSSESLEETIQEIATIYDLNDDELSHLQPAGDDGAVANVQKTVQRLLGNDEDSNAGHALSVAKSAIQSGRAAKVMATLLRAGPQAAQAAATGGKVVSKGTPWGWIATATYAVGTTGWFAYNARSFNLKAFELVREREGIEIINLPIKAKDQSTVKDTVTLKIELPTATAITSRAAALTGRAGMAVTSMFGKLRGLGTNQEKETAVPPG